MGNTQGRTTAAPAGKSPRSGKYASKYGSHSHDGGRPGRNGIDHHNTNHNGPSKHGARDTALHIPLKEYDLPDFLQLRHHPRNRRQSPVMQRNLGDPDLVIAGDPASTKGLLIPRSELEVPDFLMARNPSSEHNGRVVQAEVNHHAQQKVRMTNGPTEQVSRVGHNKRDPGNVRATSTYGLHTSNERLNMEFDSHRHGRPASKADVNPRRGHSPPAARGKFVTSSDPTRSKDISQSRESLQRSRENLQEGKYMSDVNNPVVDITDGVVDNFGDFTLKRKYKKLSPSNNTKTAQLSDEDKFAPGVTGRHAVIKQKSPKGALNGTENTSKRTQGHNNVNHWSMNDTDSIPSTSSQSFTETFSPRIDNLNLSQNLNVHPPHFELASNEEESESPGSRGGGQGLLGDMSLGYQDGSLEDSGRKIARKNSLQAHLRRRIQEYERTQKQRSLQLVRYDSDSTTVSEPSAFNESMSPVTRAQNGRYTSAINNLPDNLLLRIFTYLTTPDMCRASGVCRKWNVLCWDPVLWNTIEITNHQDSDINRILRNMLAKLASSTQGYCLTVHSLRLNGSELLSDKGLGFVARFCIDLEDLEIIGCCCVTSKGVQDVLYNCNNLRYLNLSGCTCVNSICLPTANGFNAGEHGSFIKLRHLDLSDCVAFDDLGLRMVGLTCSLLENLYLRRCSRITDVGMKHIAVHCQHLKELSTSDCYKVRDFSLKEIAKHIPTLKYLSVAKCPVSDTGIKYIGRYCVRLKYLNVRGCEAVTDAGIAFVVQNCLKLRSLDIGKCDITDNAMNTIGIHCPQLKKLSMKGCDRVTDTGIKSIAAQCCNIQYLNVQECNLDYGTFVYIRQHCRNCIIEHTCPAFF